MSDRVDDLATSVDDALVSVDELEDNPGTTKGKIIHKAQDALKEAKDAVDQMEDDEE